MSVSVISQRSQKFFYTLQNNILLYFFDSVFARTKGATVGARALAQQPDVAQECRETV